MLYFFVNVNNLSAIFEKKIYKFLLIEIINLIYKQNKRHMIIKTNYKIPKSKEKNSLIVPVFIPFWACPQICVFCNQALQTGKSRDISAHTNLESLKILLDKARHTIDEARNNDKTRKIELAFYGGTFSLLPEEEFNYALEYLENLKNNNLIHRARCSTRPDACEKSRLEYMKKKGIDTIELGVQSFSNVALIASNRGYTEDIIIPACQMIQEMGFNLGIQLMPNMPAQEVQDFYIDIEKVIAIMPDFIRLYPCLVVENTMLSKMWKNNEHSAWQEEKMIELLAFALEKMWENSIDVVRIGVAYEEDFYKKVLAGVWHPSIGQKVQILAFKNMFTKLYNEHDLDKKNVRWYFPLHSKGYVQLQKDIFWKYKKVSTSSIVWHEKENIEFEITL